MKGQVAEVRLNALHWRVMKLKSKVGKVGDYWGEQHWPEARETISKVGPVSVA